MRGYWLLLAVPLSGVAQTPPPAVTGVLLDRDAPAASGEFSLRAADHQVFRFQFDSNTAVTLDDQPMTVASLVPGERIEVRADAVPGSLVRLARSVRVLAAVVASRFTPPLPPVGSLFGSDGLTLSGVVSKRTPQLLIIRSHDGEHTLLLRPDTAFLADGSAVDAATLRPNMRVFVYAGTDLFERVIAYRVIWGHILEPKH